MSGAIKHPEMTELQRCEVLIKELMAHLNGDTDRLSKAQRDILYDAQVAVCEGGEGASRFKIRPDLSLVSMVRAVCSMRTLETVMDTRQISPHQKSVIFSQKKEG